MFVKMMSMTINQKIRKRGKTHRQIVKKSKALKGSCQRKGICIQVTTKKPKRPNSADRRVAKIKLSTGYEIFAHIPGEGHNLQEHMYVLVKGGRLQDVFFQLTEEGVQ